MYSDGTILLGGGSHLDGFAGMPYPSIQDLIENGNGSHSFTQKYQRAPPTIA
jgi:hypothetical protein